ncbi:hypothetical protein GA775_07530 [Salmonella enterica subsp. enterica serovar Enteritidis]|uniref:Uncharacterized protein n=1 Tax=Salmonella enterica I TaxID=59201 RepID=A0A3Y3XVU9_SALET|nr:hypothetical protein [Salmonella enterica subsp. enterica serovar Enteritidis]EAB9080270.1 hypothetical protein [Salmonella enterica subsp. enterica]EAS2410365.1 hypothetical protein [Salmonella enterica]EAW2067899.1 hypothetical protein [Salmonella enterica subsp. diarizonae]EBZ6087384.1 hypothetical protein [Salmonella enterica subsp. enterica serovar Kumasi]EDH3800654.1 hypothetical protein [Salmonella enterica subsp. enterica serovar Typhi]
MGFCFGRQLLVKKPASAGFFMAKVRIQSLFLPIFSIILILFIFHARSEKRKSQWDFLTHCLLRKSR